MRDRVLQWAPRTAALAGMIDASVALAYALGVSPSLWHLGTLAIKLALIVILGAPGRSLVARNAGFLVILAVAIAIQGFNPMTAPAGLAAALGFLAHFLATLALVACGRIRTYLAALATVIAGVMALYLCLVLAGAVPARYGRSLYFGGAHPNLGAEIAACGAVAAALAMHWRGAMAAGVVTLLAATVMEGRAAMLTIGLALVVRTLSALSCAAGRQTATALVALAGPPLVWLGWGPMAQAGARLMLIEDPYRGLGTGFVGREDRWSAAWSLVADRPLIGNGIGYFDAPGAHQSPHNLALYALAEFGIVLGGAMLLVMIVKALRIAMADPGRAALLATLLPMLVFNDRFINLNPYPFMVFVALAGLAAEAHTATRHAPVPDGARVAP